MPLANVAGKTRHMPDDFLLADDNQLSGAGMAYLKRLVPKKYEVGKPFVSRAGRPHPGRQRQLAAGGARHRVHIAGAGGVLRLVLGVGLDQPPEQLGVPIAASSMIVKKDGTKTSDRKVETSRPPITAIAIGARNSPPSPSASAAGQHAGRHGDGGHDDRPRALAAGIDDRLGARARPA